MSRHRRCNLREGEALQAELVNTGGTGIRDYRGRAGRADPKGFMQVRNRMKDTT
jgi:hypothetical protein